MTLSVLDDKIDCKVCGMIKMTIPDYARDDTPIHCSNCGGYLGQWGELQDDFAIQIRDAKSIEMDHGTISKRS